MEDSKKKFSFKNLQDLKFPGHEVVKSRLPKAIQLAEAVAEEWKKDGDFNGLPVGHPLSQVALGLGLRKAKDIEKKLEEKGVFTMAQIGLEYAKVQAAKLPVDKLPGPLAQFFQKEESQNTSSAPQDTEVKEALVVDEHAVEATAPEIKAEEGSSLEATVEAVSEEEVTEPEEEDVEAPVRHKNRHGKHGKHNSRRTH